MLTWCQWQTLYNMLSLPNFVYLRCKYYRYIHKQWLGKYLEVNNQTMVITTFHIKSDASNSASNMLLRNSQLSSSSNYLFINTMFLFWIKVPNFNTSWKIGPALHCITRKNHRHTKADLVYDRAFSNRLIFCCPEVRVQYVWDNISIVYEYRSSME